MTAISKNVYINKLDEIVGKYNNTYDRTIKMEPAGTPQGTCSEDHVEHNVKDTKFKFGDYVTVPK